MLCRDIFNNISGYLGAVETFKTLDLVCKSSHGLDKRRDNIVKIALEYDRMYQFAKLGYNDIFMYLYKWYHKHDIFKADNCTLFYMILYPNEPINMIMYRCVEYNSYDILSSLCLSSNNVTYSIIKKSIKLGHNEIFCLLFNKYRGTNKTNLIIPAAKVNNLFVVKYIFNEYNTILTPYVDRLFTESCIYGSIDVSKWLYNNTQCDIHYNNEACNGSKGETKQWLLSIGCNESSYIRYISNRNIKTAILEGIFGI